MCKKCNQGCRQTATSTQGGLQPVVAGVDCNGNDDTPDDNLNERLTDLETPINEQNDEAYMDGCLERSCHK